MGEIQKNQAPLEKELDDDLVKSCSAFLKVRVPVTNIILENDFDKFMPLFNKDRMKACPKEELDHLGSEYYGRFSLQHPIQILSNMSVDDSQEGVVYPKDGRKHLLVREIPAAHRAVRTLNDLGQKIPMLMTAFAKSCANQTDPLHNNRQKYADDIGKALDLANQKDPNLKKQHEEFVSGSKRLLNAKAGELQKSESEKESKPKEDAPTTGLFDWD